MLSYPSGCKYVETGQLFESELKLTQDRAKEFLAVIALYRALGGGWQDDKELADVAGLSKETVK